MTEKHILIVDDDYDLLVILKRSIELICAECRVWIATNGKSASKNRQKPQPDHSI
jgi:ActR/RegA family two-component response regulator